MHRIPKLLKLLSLCLLLFLSSTVNANDTPIRVVTSFSILEDLASQLGGDHVTVFNLVGRNSDAHMYRPRPSDAIAIANADLIIFNGLSFEGWMTRLLENRDKNAMQLIVSEGVDPMLYDGETDPHAWQSFHNIRIYIENITASLITLMPQNIDEFTQRKQHYLTALNTLEKSLEEQLRVIPPAKRIVVTSHDAFGYLGREFDIQFLTPVGLSLDDEASAEDVASIIDQIRKNNVQALFIENINNPRLIERIASETNVDIGGRLYSDALSELNGPAGTYLKMMRHNVESLIAAF